MRMITRDEDLRQAVTDLGVENKVEIVSCTKKTYYLRELEDFALEVARKKGWKVETVCGLQGDALDGAGCWNSLDHESEEQTRGANGEKSGNDRKSMWVLRPILKQAA